MKCYPMVMRRGLNNGQVECVLTVQKECFDQLRGGVTGTEVETTQLVACPV